MAGLGRQSARRTENDAGAAAVEFALILPVLLLIVLGIINFGYLFGQKLALNQAVREGARAAVVSTTGAGADPITLVRAAAQGSLIDDSPTITLLGVDGGNVASCSGDGVGQSLQVKVSYATAPLVPMLIPGMDAFTLEAEAVFRCEW